jgi:hypothetical protein
VVPYLPGRFSETSLHLALQYVRSGKVLSIERSPWPSERKWVSKLDISHQLPKYTLLAGVEDARVLRRPYLPRCFALELQPRREEHHSHTHPTTMNLRLLTLALAATVAASPVELQERQCMWTSGITSGPVLATPANHVRHYQYPGVTSCEMVPASRSPSSLPVRLRNLDFWLVPNSFIAI